MVERDKIVEILRSYLPNIGEQVLGRIADDIVRDVESITHSIIRQTVAQKRVENYWQGRQQ